MRKHCQRRRYDLSRHPVREALLGGVIPAADWLPLRTRELMCLDALAAGTGHLEDVLQLRASIETAAGLAGMGYGPETLPALQAARAALLRIGAQPPGAMLAGAGDLADLREALTIHDAQREVVPRRDHERAAARSRELVERRM